MVAEMHRQVLYGCPRKDRPGCIPPKEKAKMTVSPEESCFYLQSQGRTPLRFGPESFKELPAKPKNKTATQLDIFFVEDDERKSLALKFNSSDDMNVIYFALYPIFKTAGKLHGKEKKFEMKLDPGLSYAFCNSPGAKPRGRDENVVKMRTAGVDHSKRSEATKFRLTSPYDSVNSRTSQRPALKYAEAASYRPPAAKVVGRVVHSPSETECRDGPVSPKMKNDAENTVVDPGSSISMNGDIQSPAKSAACPSYSSMVVVKKDAYSHSGVEHCTFTITRRDDVPTVTKSNDSPTVTRSNDVPEKQSTSAWGSRPFASRRNRQASLNFTDQILKSPWRFRSFVNLGNSCYMNAVLQIIFYSEGVRNRLSRLDAQRDFSKDSTRLLTSLLSLQAKMTSLKYEKVAHYKLRDFLRTELANIREDSGTELDSEFSSYRQQDAHEYWSKLLDRIEHNCLCFKKDFKIKEDRNKENSSLVDNLHNPGDLFKIKITTSLGCSNCPETKAPRTEELLDMKLDIGGNSFCEESVECLIKKSLRIEELEFKCDKCGEAEANKTQAVCTFPQYLVLVIMRYDFNSYGRKKNNHISVNRDLYLADIHVDSTVKKEERNIFLLEHRSKKMEQVPPVVSSCSDSEMPMEEEKKTVFSYSDALSGKRASLGSDGSDTPPIKYVCSIERTLPEDDAAHSDFMEVDTTPVNCGNEDDEFMETSPMKNGLYGGDSSNINHSYGDGDGEDVHNDSVIVSDTTISEPVKFFKPLVSSVLERIRSQLNITHLLSANNDCSYDSLFLPECELFSAEPPEIHSIAGDGNCLFRSISWWLFNGDDSKYDVLRKKITKFLSMFPQEFYPLLSDHTTMEEHIRNMRNDREWGTQTELSAVATMFCCPVYTYHDSSWKRFSPMFTFTIDEKTGRFEKCSSKAEKIDVFETGAMYLSNEEGCHYSPAIGRKIRNENHSLDHPEPVYVYKDSNGPVYTLTGAINHIGTTMTSGHYKAITYDEAAGVWVNCDDAIISVISEKEVLDEVGRNGYMLIYKKRTEGDEMDFTHSLDYLKKSI